MAQEAESGLVTRLERENEQLRRENERLKQQVERLRRQLEEALRAGKRQAAPFSRGAPKTNPKKPGRKPGYRPACRRPIPDQVDETLEAPLPPECPQCQGAVKEDGVVHQYQTEIPQPRVLRIHFRIHVGHCQRCGRRVQGRHPRQTSDAVGGAASQLGPRAVGLATQLNKGLGLSHGKTAAVLEAAFGLRVSRGGLCQAFQRVAQKAEPTYDALIEEIRTPPVVTSEEAAPTAFLGGTMEGVVVTPVVTSEEAAPTARPTGAEIEVRTPLAVTADETGWKVGGHRQWMWVFVSAQLTVYSIQPGRGFEQAAAVLGVGFNGRLVHDGWIVYDQFQQALHQTCVGHLLCRCKEMILIASPSAARFPQKVQHLLQQALALRDRRDAHQISDHGLAVARGRIEAQMQRLLECHYRCPANERLAKHLDRNFDCLFTFLYYPGLEATNWRAEQALRPAVVTRKVWGGNRNVAGAHTQEVLASVLQTCRQQQRSWLSLAVDMLCSPLRKAGNLLANDRSPPQEP